MKPMRRRVLAAVCLAAMLFGGTATLSAQAPAVSERSPMYSYQTIWTIPRTLGPAIDKAGVQEQDVLARQLAEGPLIAWGKDTNLLHSDPDWTHVTWWASSSLGGVFQVLDTISRSSARAAPVYAAATKEVNGVYVSRHYNWRPGSYRGLYTHIGIFTLKSAAPGDAIETISKTVMVPLLEKLLAQGTLVEYEIDEEVFRKGSPRMFFMNYMVEHPDDLARVDAALTEAFAAHPMTASGPEALIDFSVYRDSLSRTNTVVFK